MPTENLDEIKIPTEDGNPFQQHGQIMFVLGQIVATQKAMIGRQDITNGKVIKLESRMDSAERWQATQDGRSKGISSLWLVVFNVMTAIVAITALILKFIK